MISTITCLKCGKTFLPKRSSSKQKFCSMTCSSSYSFPKGSAAAIDKGRKLGEGRDRWRSFHYEEWKESLRHPHDREV